ncbi:MAG: HupE/UreJ family protein [Gammaproteobacteria bacterium]|nr:HupE/UreJ family protein [Gammaproteobacteria bacterium]
MAPLGEAHEIPSDVTVRFIVHPGTERIELLVRVPLEAMQDMAFPTLGPGYLDIERADSELKNAALRWLADDIRLYANGAALTPPRLIAVMASIPSDRSFVDYESARKHVLGPALPAATQLVWRQALLDALFEIPVESPGAAIAIRPGLDRLGLKVTSVIRFEADDGVTRMYETRNGAERIELDPRWHTAALRFVKQGFEHIAGGADHLLFLLCLVLPFRKDLRALVWIVTAFTVAHSITLIGSAYGMTINRLWFTPLVEVLIAASILYMAVENVIKPNARMRWILAFGFGLVHGFGFSFALRNTLQFAGDHVLLSLLSFNLGVELGQLLVLALLIPALWLLFRYVVAERIGTIVISVFIAHSAWHWMGERYAVLEQFLPG